ncbi:hypothetical protein DPEC_G00040450 [Dallia pectoralis]|uniref:Uncharacterized protein n=1 Tax=Dallia pectoralis TaxID=75939 RepID=A0ACC2HEM3_DALPE|nr:hypothetical protein DPEC_G00040450 [Dallia pectoralis]
MSTRAVQCVLENFEAVSLADLKKAVHELKPTTCTLDAVPAKILKEAIDIIGLPVLGLLHLSLHPVRNLGVIFDQNMQHDKQISAVVKASFYQLRLLSKVKPFLSRADLEKAIHAFISSRLDYCNALYIGLNKSLLNRFQLVQNSAARLLCNISKRSHITPILRSLHWLPVRFRVEYKVLLFVFKAINGMAPAKITISKKFGGRPFAVQGPKLWNALPPHLQSITVLSVFKSQLSCYRAMVSMVTAGYTTRGLKQEEDITDLHLSLDWDNAVKKPTLHIPERVGSMHINEYVASDTLSLSRRRLKDVTEHIWKITSLKNLYLEGNEISILPATLFTNLSNLVWLDLRNNKITSLPADIGVHRCLKTLLLEGNPIIELPLELGNVISLKALSLRHCPIKFPPQEIVQQDLQSVLQYLRSAMAKPPVNVRQSLLDMPHVEKLQLTVFVKSSMDTGEEMVDEEELQRFRELRQKMIQMDQAEFDPLSSECNQGHRTHTLPTIKRTRSRSLCLTCSTGSGQRRDD